MTVRESKSTPWIVRGVATAAIAVGALLLAAAPAHAADVVDITFDPTSTTAVYGDSWGFQLNSQPSDCSYNFPCAGTLTVSPTGGSAIVVSYPAYGSNSPIGDYTLFAAGHTLNAGEYSLSAAFAARYPDFSPNGSSSTPAKLTITATPIAVDLRVATDPSSTRNAIVSAALTGPLIDLIANFATNSPPPEGSWKLSIVDAAGTVVFEKDVPSSAATFVSVYWQDVPAATDFTASATYTPAAATAGNVTVTNATAVSYTSPGADPADTNPTVPPEPVEPAAPSPASVPVWLLILCGLVGAGLITAIVIFSVRLRHLGSTTEATPGDDANRHEDDPPSAPSPPTSGTETVWTLDTEENR